MSVVDRRDLAIVVDSRLDDYPLDPFEFRVYARIVRRAGKEGEHREFNKRTALETGMGERKVRAAKAVLVKCRLIEVLNPDYWERGERQRVALRPYEDWIDPDLVPKVRAWLSTPEDKRGPDPLGEDDDGGAASPDDEGPSAPDAEGTNAQADTVTESEDEGPSAPHAEGVGTTCRGGRHHMPGGPAPHAEASEGIPRRGPQKGSPENDPKANLSDLRDGFPILPDDDRTYTETVLDWCASRNLLPDRPAPLDEAIFAVTMLAEHGGMDQRRRWLRLSTVIVADYVETVTGEPIQPAERRTLHACVADAGPTMVLRACQAAATAGAGLTEEHANNPLAFVRYANAIIRRERAEHDRPAV